MTDNNTFQKDVTFLSKVFVPGEDGNAGVWEEKPVTKTVTFKDLNQTDKKQHRLHFKIVALFTGAEKQDDESNNVKLDSDTIYDLSVKSINELAILDEEFKAEHKNELLSDSGAIFNFGFWFLGEKITPFFSKLMNS